MKLIVGLGNPGRKYANTPHNAGYEVVDELAARCGWRWRRARRVDAECADGRLAGVECLLLKPTTFMNLSGEAVAPMLRWDRLDAAQDLLVVLDDVAIPLGRLRLKPSGSSGGHKGLESIRQHLHSSEFCRLRYGVGPREDDPEARERIGDLAAFVLAPWPRPLRAETQRMTLLAADAVEAWLAKSLTEVMTAYNGK